MIARVKRTAVKSPAKEAVDIYGAAPKSVQFLNTGCTLLNLTTSARGDGGWPFGRIVNIIGDKCLSADTVVSAQRGGRPRKMTMQTLFNRVKGNHWNRGESETYLVADVGGHAGTAKMLDIVMSGDKRLYELTNAQGDSIKASEDHKFSTADGWLCLSDGLKVGTPVKCWRGTRDKAEWERNRKPRHYTYSIPFHPFGQRNAVGGRDYKRLLTARLVLEAAINGLALPEFVRILRKDPATAATLQYTDPELDVHHLDGDCTNDSLDNLQLIDPAEHWEIHADEMPQHTKKVDLREIVSIRRVGEEPTFDITMEAPHHNFIANNFVVHNSTGKTLLAEEAMMNFQRAFPDGKSHYRETEAAFDKDYAQWLGLDLDKVDFGPSREDDIWETVQDVFDDLKVCLDEIDAVVNARAQKLRAKNKKLKAGDAREQARETLTPSLYIVDSLDALSSEDELKRDRQEGSYNLGKQKAVNELFRHYRKRIRLAKVCLIFISQTRKQIGPFIRGAKYRRACGDPLDFYSSVVLYLSELGKLKKTIKMAGEEITRVTGIRIRAKCEKNKIVSPHEECVFTIRFQYGIDDELSSLEYLKDLNRLEDAGFSKMPSDLADVDAGKLRNTVATVWHEISKRFAPVKGKYAA